MRRIALNVTAVAAFGLLASSALAADKSVEMLHFWTSGGEAEGVRALKDALAAKGIEWKDAAVAGGTGANAYQVLRSRLAAGTPPSGAQMHIQETLAWANQGLLRDLSPLAEKDGWREEILPAIQSNYEVGGKWVAVPVTMHRSNWLWYNSALLMKVGAEPPKSWDEFNAIADKLKAAGITPLALGGQNWQYGDLLESVIVAKGGADFYRKIVAGDLDAIKSDTMISVFDQIAKLRGYVDANSPGRDWNLATAMVINGEAAFQIMGDWAKAEFALAGKKPGIDYGCVASPGTDKDFIWLVDNFAFFNLNDKAAEEAQNTLAETVLDPNVQVDFAIKKGSIPVIDNVDATRLDACGQKSYEDRKNAATTNGVVPSIFHNAALPAAQTGVYLDVVSEFFVTPSMTSKDAVEAIVTGLGQL
ncbi:MULTISPECIES: ABC transporter substrate-binding protein [unclassified Rhizobium]|uniref:ABC transporter substrate-binding protein n=1 Tax=unclassified Rhizobium TaxID=2613769 RepID=UPI000BE7F81F|nr:MULTISPECIES: ABC transporter substrate-binding protein [unclassified Rhizobium]MDF0661702.1 ABC transporter substrate-binding protein [Rhizobium sp. BC49]PDS87630.1 sugar ABC transporter substrate-binding protein [Rhizobium sp. L18]